jgi:hypothetical protein
MATTDRGDEELTAETALARAAAGELLGPSELAAILRLKKSAYHARAKAGDFDHLKTRPAIGTKCYSGVLIMRWLQGEPVYEPTFGRKRRA